MNAEEAKRLIDIYIDWLRDRTSLDRLTDQVCEITTPFLDRHNDRLQIYLRKANDHFLLTDDGYTIADLKTSGLRFEGSEKRQRLLNTVLNGFGVQIEDNVIFTHANIRDFAQKKHSLVQALLAVNDLFSLARAEVFSFFLEDVRNWLSTTDVRFSQAIKLVGKSGFDHHFDFLIPASKKKNERAVRAINRPTKSNSENFLWALWDVQQARGENTDGIAILNDIEIEMKEDVLEAFRKYEVLAIPWSQRNRYVDQIAA